MVSVGKLNKLKVVKILSFGAYLDGEDYGEILLPTRYMPADSKMDDWIDVFLYFDSEDRIIATTETPYAMVDDFACLQVVSVNNIGAFLDWGLSKHLLVPFREQQMKMEEGRRYVVKIYFDPASNRIAASAKLDKYLGNLPPVYEEGDEVDLLIYGETDLGFKAIVNSLDWGMLYKNEVFQPLERGQRLKGYIKKVREDEKIDLCLLKPGYEKVDGIALKILDHIKANNGFIGVTDKSSPEIIYDLFGVSKKVYKKAIGSLYRNGIVKLENNGVRLSEEEGD